MTWTRCSEWLASCCATSIRRGRCACWACAWPASTRVSSARRLRASWGWPSSRGQRLFAIETAVRAHGLSVAHDPDDGEGGLHWQAARPALGVEPGASDDALARVDQVRGLPAEAAPDLPRVRQI